MSNKQASIKQANFQFSLSVFSSPVKIILFLSSKQETPSAH